MRWPAALGRREGRPRSSVEFANSIVERLIFFGRAPGQARHRDKTGHQHVHPAEERLICGQSVLAGSLVPAGELVVNGLAARQVVPTPTEPEAVGC